MRVCKDGRIWGQNNKEARDHLGILTGRRRRKGETTPEDRRRMKEYYERNKVPILLRQCEYQRGYSKTEQGRANKIANVNRMAVRYPEKHKARYTLRNAIRLGKVERGCCEVCGSAEVEAHHDDYTKPLEVRWLCPLHHRIMEGRWIPKVQLENK